MITPLYIGLIGLAGSGKDTVAKMLKTILSDLDMSLEECKEQYFEKYKNPTQSATYDPDGSNDSSPVYCIAYADQLKEVCAKMFGIPRKKFYQNKSNAWICINDKFQYTEIYPPKEKIITAQQFYEDYGKYSDPYSGWWWMSLRDILVYVGTYILQKTINGNIFVNILRNSIAEQQRRNKALSYVIVTDNRFPHEVEFVKENSGVVIKITRDKVSQMDNIAEKSLDDFDDYNFLVNNSKGYDELMAALYHMVHSNDVFKNVTYRFDASDNLTNYIRMVGEDHCISQWKLHSELGLQKQYLNSDGDIIVIEPIGGPMISIGEKIESTDLLCQSIYTDESGSIIIKAVRM